MKMIAACSRDGIIGVNNSIPWKIKADVRRFKTITTGGVIIMGRSTYESIGQPLPNRRNIVVSTNKNVPAGTEHMFIPDVIETFMDDTDAWIIGGQSLYEQTMEYCEFIDLTIVPIMINKYSSSVKRFPWINPMLWSIASNEHGEDNTTIIKYIRTKI